MAETYMQNYFNISSIFCIFSNNNWRWKEQSTVLTFYDFQFLVTRFYRVDTDTSPSNEYEDDEGSNYQSSSKTTTQICNPNSWRGRLY